MAATTSALIGRAHPLGNGRAGVYIWSGASSNTVGGATAGAGDVISSNAQSGVIIDASSANVVAGDFIGVDRTGMVRLGNVADGVVITNGGSGNLIGGYTAAARDIISANGIDGVQIDYTGTSANVVAGDYIGTDVTGTHALGNTRAGVYIWSGASSNTVGGTIPGARDVISANGFDGVILDAGSGA